jgi:nucleoside phosphorylase
MLPDGELDAQDALDVLGDLPEWRLTAVGWAAVMAIVERLAAAVETLNIAAIRAATADLELASPLRLTQLGPSLVAPPPRRLRLIRNRLVHVLEATAFDAALRSDATPPAETRIAEASRARSVSPPSDAVTEELVIHMFASLSGPGTSAAYQRIVRLWDACRDVLGANEPFAALALPTALPSEPPSADRPGDEALGACRDAAGAVQAIVRRLPDAVCLSVGIGGSGTTWAECAARWQAAAVPGDDGPLLGTVTIFAGTVAGSPVASPTTARMVLAELPGVLDDYWCDEVSTLAGTALWELDPAGDDRHRRLLVLAAQAPPHDPVDVVSALVWTYGGKAPTPFTSYLLNAANIRYELGVREASDAVVSGDPGAAERWLATMSTTGAIARDNMARCLEALGTDGQPADGPLGDDFAMADTLMRQLKYDMRYVRIGATGQTGTEPLVSPVPKSAASRLDGPAFGLLTALPEEFTAMRGLIDDGVPVDVKGDRARYIVGTMPSADPDRPHRVVLTMLGETGTAAAAHAVANLTRSFGSVSQLIMVGVAAGVPALSRPEKHVRLGDVVVGTWNVVDFDHIVDTPQGPQQRQQFPQRSAYLAAWAKLLVSAEMRGERPWETVLANLIKRLGKDFARPPDSTDVLYADDADGAMPIGHPPRSSSGHRRGQPKVHQGRIGSSDRSIRSIAARDELAARHDLRAIEMEGTGIGMASHASGRDWFVIRGISDYADARLGTAWRKYAAAAAAAYVRTLLAANRPVFPYGEADGWD